MAQVDFYLLSQPGKQARQVFACRLVEKIYGMGLSAYLSLPDHGDCILVDDLLWTFSQGSFIPHCLEDQDDRDRHPVVIGKRNRAPEGRKVFVNLRDELPESTGDVERIAEVIDNDESSRRQARQRYRQYQSQGYEIVTHEL